MAKSFFHPLFVGTIGELYEANILLRDEERAKGAVRVVR